MKNTEQLPLVTRDQAEKLRTLGFDVPCQTFYEGVSKSADYAPFLKNYNRSSGIVSAPTIALALWWIREEKKFAYTLSWLPSHKWGFSYGKFEYGYFSSFAGYKDSLDEADSALLDALLTQLEEGGNDD